jgi:hypothetical protein
MTRSSLHSTVGKMTTSASALTLHNLAHQLKLMDLARQSIIDGRFPDFVKQFFRRYYKSHANYPSWAVDALRSVNIDLMEDAGQGIEPKKGQGVQWEYANEGVALQSNVRD